MLKLSRHILLNYLVVMTSCSFQTRFDFRKDEKVTWSVISRRWWLLDLSNVYRGPKLLYKLRWMIRCVVTVEFLTKSIRQTPEHVTEVLLVYSLNRWLLMMNMNSTRRKLPKAYSCVRFSVADWWGSSITKTEPFSIIVFCAVVKPPHSRHFPSKNCYEQQK